MKRLFGVAVLSLLLLVPALVLGASLEGKLTKIDEAAKQIVLQTEKGDMILQLSESLEITEEVKVGDNVQVEFTEIDGKLTVTKIRKAT